jgi:MFS family permease
LGIAIFQPITGYLMDRVGKIGGAFPLQAYHNAFTLCLIAVFIAFFFSLLLPRMRKSL